MRDEYRIVMFDQIGERMARVLTVEARTSEEAILKVAVRASEFKREIRGERDCTLALQKYDPDLGAWVTREDMKCGVGGRWFV